MKFLSQLPPTTAKSKKRIGRGYGSGKGGHTSGRGRKGFKARDKVKLTFDGSKIKKSWIKRTPFLRGKHRQLPSPATLPISLSQLNSWFKDGQIVSASTLAKFISPPSASVKILASGQLKKAFKIKNLPLSSAALAKIIKAGGSILK